MKYGLKWKSGKEDALLVCDSQCGVKWTSGEEFDYVLTYDSRKERDEALVFWRTKFFSSKFRKFLVLTHEEAKAKAVATELKKRGERYLAEAAAMAHAEEEFADGIRWAAQTMIEDASKLSRKAQ